MSGLPPTLTIAFGTVSVSGRNRSPLPAARIMARMDARSLAFQFVQQTGQRSKRGVALADVPGVADEPRRIGQVLGLAVAIVDAREDAEHLEMALQPHPFEGTPEFAEVRGYRQGRGARFLPIPHRP